MRYFACTALLKLGFSSTKVIETLSALREIPEAVQFVLGCAESGVLMAAMEDFGDEIDELAEDSTIEEFLDVLRKKKGVEAVPFPSADPIEELVARAKSIYHDLTH